MTPHPLLTSLIDYKLSADDDLLTALSNLEQAGARPELHAALRVLNHIHIVDRIFAAHLQKLPHAFTASWMPEPPSLAELAEGIRTVDTWYRDYIADAEANDLSEVIDFTFTDGSRGRMTREEMLAHVVTHSGYHRGEIGRLLPEIEETASTDVFAGYLHRADPQRRLPSGSVR